MPARDPPEWEFKERDVLVLRELSRDPQLSSRDLADILETKHDIDVSHVTVSESIRAMREEGVVREAIIPNDAY
ncbi:winged helix-turn-helix domain-containing protein, partial [Natronomonas gomsonensis]